jgi:MFS transporter, FSR family, fosmidomycin resistance protein
MTSPSHQQHRQRTLALCTVLHAFTHVYQVALLPLYFLIQKDLGLARVEQATFLVTALMISYFAPSFFMGIMADYWSRKKILAWGLAINGLGFIALSQAKTYSAALLCMIVAGIGGSFFHPAATALVVRLFPGTAGKALGFLGIGAGVGFFAGPIYCGWRASTAGWRAPLLELGILGVITAAIFAFLADDEAPVAHGAEPPRERMFASVHVWVAFIAAALAFSLRDFTGSSMGSLGSLFLQRAHGLDLKSTGAILSAIFLASAISNPVFGKLSDKGRLKWTLIVLSIALIFIVLFPRVSPAWSAPVLALYGFFFMASYPMVEAALMESVHDSVRGRVFGLFITIGGICGNLAHWAMGAWVEHLGPAAQNPRAYYSIYYTLAALVVV